MNDSVMQSYLIDSATQPASSFDTLSSKLIPAELQQWPNVTAQKCTYNIVRQKRWKMQLQLTGHIHKVFPF